MTPNEAFKEVLGWEGSGYDGAIKQWIKEIYGIEIGSRI